MHDGGYFVGDCNAQFRPHGKGIRFAVDGLEVASGQWRDGKQHGRGKMIFSSGDRYDGEFVDDKYSGLGVYTWADGRVHEGEWANGRRSGLGVEWTKDGDVEHCGRWANIKLVESCPVPRNKIPIGSCLSAHGPTAAL